MQVAERTNTRDARPIGQSTTADADIRHPESATIGMQMATVPSTARPRKPSQPTASIAVPARIAQSTVLCGGVRTVPTETAAQSHPSASRQTARERTTRPEISSGRATPSEAARAREAVTICLTTDSQSWICRTHGIFSAQRANQSTTPRSGIAASSANSMNRSHAAEHCSRR